MILLGRQLKRMDIFPDSAKKQMGGWILTDDRMWNTAQLKEQKRKNDYPLQNLKRSELHLAQLKLFQKNLAWGEVYDGGIRKTS